MAAQITHAAIGAAASGLATAAIHQTALDAATIANIDKTNLDGVTKTVTVGTTSPTTDGEQTWHTTSLVASKGPSRRLQIFDSTAGVAVEMAEALYSASTPASGFQIVGLLWRDMTLHIWRRWEDAVTAPNGVAGWHPIDSAYQLWKNETVAAATVDANKVVVHRSGGTADLRTFDTTVNVKDQAVVGVTMESIANATYGVVAMVSGGTQVNVLCDDAAADGAVAKGDFLCSYSVAGEARTAGAQTASSIVSAGNHTRGTPMGAFAVALGTKDGVTHLVKAKLLGFVGAGADAHMDEVLIYRDDTPPAGSATVQACQSASGVNGAQSGVNDTFISAKHLPILAARVNVHAQGIMAAGGSEMILSVGPTATVECQRAGVMGQGAGDLLGFKQTLLVPTRDAGSATLLGNSFAYTDEDVNMTSVDTIRFSLCGYTY